jgi:hypothetical protein
MDNNLNEAQGCIYERRCGFVKLLKTDSKQFWINRYCNGDKQYLCKRRSFSAHGLVTPDKLLPNGTYIE